MIAEEKFEEWIIEAIESLPCMLREKLANIHISIEDEPPLKLKQVFPSKNPLVFLGLYEGVPLTKRRIYHMSIAPDRITIFRRAIEQMDQSEEKIREVVIKTILHEIGHYFGFSEQELRELENFKRGRNER